MRDLTRLPAAVLAGATIGLVALASPALADVFTETVAVTGSNTAATGVSDEPGINISAPAFNQALGTVTGLSAQWYGTLDVDLQYLAVSGTTAQPQSVVATGRPVFSIGTSFVDLTPITLQVVCQSGECNTSQNETLPFNQTFTLPAAPDPFPVGASASVVSTLPAPLNPEDISDRSMLLSSVAFTFTYTPITAVPEPASWALLLAGGLGMIGLTRRKEATRPAR